VLWPLLAADLLAAVGCGLTQPYTLVFLHAKGFALPLATALLSLLALSSLVGNPVSGVLIDRVGGRPVMAGGLVVSAAGLVVVALAPGVPGCAAGIAVVGLGASTAIPALSTVIGSATSEAERSRVYTMEYALFNVGLAIGTALGAVGVSAGRAGMAVQWPIGAAAYAAAAAMVAAGWLRSHPTVPAAPPSTAEPRQGYRGVLSDRRLLGVLAMALIVNAAGYGLYSTAIPALSVAAVDARALTWAGVANCTVVIAGLPVSLAVPARLGNRRALGLAAGLWSAGWLLCAVAAVKDSPLSVRMAVVGAAALTGCCELLVAGALPAMVNDLAPEQLRGRYNAVLTLTMTGGSLLAPLGVASAVGAGSLRSAFVVGVGLFVVLVTLLLRTRQPRPAALP
jgi:MFS family permease